ncbi:endonuclease domain-containing 1 protein-like [Anabas testudineus]|uniref:endonuclease domain-containing 1 protein-like n=1 Tax=Anabas testudineus TaxID=64144 RepID=UPI000E45B4F2|nr:endonuclease domain-containing 1 protein-like [Anabas testudineus]
MMTPLKMCCLQPLAVLLLSISRTETEVVKEMSQCEGFILNKPPQVPGILEKGQIKEDITYKVICQTYGNKTRFVTLYDTNNKIPVFSAYKYRGQENSEEKEERPKTHWKIEPQLEDRSTDKNMKNCDQAEYKNQASDNDYKNNKDYNRGHLFPSSYGFDGSDKISTCTLTNIVPQAISFNSGSWNKMEKYIKCILDNYCENKEGYVVTGAKASPDKQLSSRVNIPSMLWSAFCCYSHQNRKWIAGAFWGDNVQDESKTKHLTMRTLTDLYDELSTGRTRFEAFPGPRENTSKCPLKETAEESLRALNIKTTCKYPPENLKGIFHKDNGFMKNGKTLRIIVKD